MPAGISELEMGALTAWTPAQQAALNHSHMAEQLRRDEEREAKEEAAKKKKKAKGKSADDGIKVDKITTEAVLADLLKAHVPALFAFLDIFGPVQYTLPILILVHVAAWYVTPDHLTPLLPLFLTHILPFFMSFRALYYPSSLLDRANDEAKAAWQKQCEALKKSGKDKADFPDPPAPPEGWQICISDRVSWTAYFFWVGMMEWVEHMAFEGETWGLLWWPRRGGFVTEVFFSFHDVWTEDQLKVLTCISLYWVWDKDDKGRQTMGAAMLISPFLPNV